MNTTAMIIIAVPLFLLGNTISAADNSYVGQEKRVIKALSSEEIADYTEGRGMGTSKAAELNHYPGPKHVLDATEPLQLTAEQREKIQAVYASMNRDAKRIGQQIIVKEAELDALYAHRVATLQDTRRLVDEISRLQADFRFSHLSAHLAMPGILTTPQLLQYDGIRGYSSGQGSEEKHQHRH
jgi:hypothetical protein